MSRLLTAYANMLEASVRTPERLPGPRATPKEADIRLRVIALLRAMSPHEADALLRDNQQPDRLAALADEVGLSIEECGRHLAGIAWKFSEGLNPSFNSGRHEADSPATSNPPV